MRRDDPEVAFAEIQLCDNGSTRLEAREPQAAAMIEPRFGAHQQSIAVPTVSLRQIRLYQQPHTGFLSDRLRVEQSILTAKSLVDFLQGDQIRLKLFDHAKNSLGLSSPVGSSTFVDVVRRDLHCKYLHRG